MNHSRWKLLPTAPDRHLVNTLNLPPLLIQILYNRGIVEPHQFKSFIAADEQLAGNPFQLPGMERAVGRIYQALLSGEKIAIYGDFDVDGITATAIMVEGLSLLGVKATPYIPHRLTEGYGIKTAALENLYQQGNTLVISVDCGITAIPEVKRANKLGLDVIITDHHTPRDELPPAVAVIDPKLPNSDYPFTELAGVGVAFKLLQALFQGVGKEDSLNELADLVALGTVADMVPLVGENRYLVKRGLKHLNESTRLGIREMICKAEIEAGSIDSQSISWIIAPRLNAAGRLAHAMTSYNLLTTSSQDTAIELSTWLEQKNKERRNLTAKVLARVRDRILAEGISTMLIAGDTECPPGISGLVASRLADEFYRPAVVIKVGDQMSTGSCRSIPEFNIIDALNQCSQLLTMYGGHSQAAGFTLPTKNLSSFSQQLSQFARARLDGLDLLPGLNIDAEVTLSEIADAFPLIQQLAPFGYGNPLPTFLSRQIEVVDCLTMGNNGSHLRLKLRQGGTVWDAVAFELGNDFEAVSSNIDIVYNMEMDKWRGNERLRLNIIDFSPSGQSQIRIEL